MIKEFNRHYRKAINLLEDCSPSEKMDMAEKVLEWFRELPEEYLISLALLFNEAIDDLHDDSVEKINLKGKRRKKEEEEEEEEEEKEEEEETDEYDEEDDDEDDKDRDDY